MSPSVPLEAFRPGVPGNDVAPGIEHEDGVVSGPVDKQTKLFGLPSRPLFILEDFDKSTHLGLKDDRHQRLYQKVHCSERIPFLHLRAVDVGGCEKDDGRVSGAAAAPDQLGRLEAADPRHDDIEEDDGEFFGLYKLERFLAGMGFHEVLLEGFENRPQGEKVGRIVIHQKNARLRLGRYVPRKVQGFRQFRHIPSSWVKSLVNRLLRRRSLTGRQTQGAILPDDGIGDRLDGWSPPQASCIRN
jgi:hypothetical protein